MEKVQIVKRIDPCTCGCKGQDPWHKQFYKRIVREIREETGTARLLYLDGGKRPYTKTGIAKFPWGKTRVVYDYGWAIDYDSFYRVINGEPA